MPTEVVVVVYAFSSVANNEKELLSVKVVVEEARPGIVYVRSNYE